MSRTESQSVEKKTYTPPKLTHHGDLVEITQSAPGSVPPGDGTPGMCS